MFVIKESQWKTLCTKNFRMRKGKHNSHCQIQEVHDLQKGEESNERQKIFYTILFYFCVHWYNNFFVPVILVADLSRWHTYFGMKVWMEDKAQRKSLKLIFDISSFIVDIFT